MQVSENRCDSVIDRKDPKLMTPREAAKFLRVSTRTIWNWKGKGLIPFHEYGGPLNKTVRFHQDELLAWGKNKPTGDTSDNPGDKHNAD